MYMLMHMAKCNQYHSLPHLYRYFIFKKLSDFDTILDRPLQGSYWVFSSKMMGLHLHLYTLTVLKFFSYSLKYNSH